MKGKGKGKYGRSRSRARRVLKGAKRLKSARDGGAVSHGLGQGTAYDMKIVQELVGNNPVRGRDNRGTYMHALVSGFTMDDIIANMGAKDTILNMITSGTESAVRGMD